MKIRQAIYALACVAVAGVASAQLPVTDPVNLSAAAAANIKVTAAGTVSGGPLFGYRHEFGWAKMPAGRRLGGVAGIIIDPDGKSVWMFERCGTANNGCALPANKNIDPILKFDTNGNLVKSFGRGMFHYPHGMHIDKDGNIWVADGVANAQPGGAAGAAQAAAASGVSASAFVGNTVRKFSPDGKLLMTIGKQGVSGKGDYEFNGVSDVIVAPDGTIFVADGHSAIHQGSGPRNNRIVKYDKSGKYLMEWGAPGTAPEQFNPAHGLAMDSQGLIYVADRSNAAVKVFDQNGKLLHNWPQFGLPSGVFVDKNDMLYVADCNSNDNPKDQWFHPTFSPGIRIASVKDGKIIANLPEPVPGAQEGVTVDADGNIYGAYTNVAGSHRYMKLAN